MKALKSLLSKKSFGSSLTTLDDKTVFFVFKKVIKEDFGSVGETKFIPDYFSRKTLFVRSESAAWSSELWMNKKRIIEKINKELGENVLGDIKIK